MCGILGVVCRSGSFQKSQVKAALDLLSHRGPDDYGLEVFTIDERWDVFLAHRRLSILDLSPLGHQPMVLDGRNGKVGAAIVFNGEIYNHLEVRRGRLYDHAFKSRSDTETLLAALKLNGTNTLPELNGMFAFSFLDLESRSILLARDRLGKKPLYVYQNKELLIFASELKPIRHLQSSLSIDHDALAYYKWLGYIPGQMTIYKDCNKFPAASFSKIDLSKEYLQPLDTSLFWDPIASYGKLYARSYDDAKDELEALIDDAVAIRAVADVPVGVFLSGGIDSSLVAASLAYQRKDVQAFTVSFSDPAFDESSIAESTASDLKIGLHKLHLNQEDFDRQLEKIPFHFDEPFSDSSQIPTLAISEAAKKYVTVVLTGDGGDEIFLGYPRFHQQAKLMSLHSFLRAVPGLDRMAFWFFGTKSGFRLLQTLMSRMGVGNPSANWESKLARIRALLALEAPSGVYETIMCVNQKSWLDAKSARRLGESDLMSTIKSWYPQYEWDALLGRSTEEKLAAFDLITYLRDDVLVKVDRSTMANSLEARSPLLDYRIVEFGLGLPREFKFHQGKHKRILRDVLGRRLNGDLLSLGKRGFGVPLPEGLPLGPSMPSRWNAFIEAQWKLMYV